MRTESSMDSRIHEASKANPKGMSKGLAELNTKIITGVKLAKVIPVVGVVAAVADAGYELANGRSASSIGAGIIGGAAVGSGATAVFASFIPTPAVVVGIAGLMTVAGVGAGKWLWEASVPLDAREAIDAWFVGPPPQLAGGSLANMPGVTR
jgi:hypothetical protein